MEQHQVNQKSRMSHGSEGKTRIGLVLEGGGTRGIYTAGVLDLFMEKGQAFDGVIGVSAGAIHGASFVSGQKGRSIRYYKKYCGDRRFMSFWNLITTGDLVGRDFCYRRLPEELDPYDYDTFNASQTEFYAGCSNLETGKPAYLRVRDMKEQIDLIRASASMPYVSRIVDFEGMKLLDGGCTDSIPLEGARSLGFSRNVVILTRHEGYVKKPENASLAGLFYGKYPEFVKALKNRYRMYNDEVERLRQRELAKEAFVIRPSQELTIGRLERDPEKLQAVYDLGWADGEKAFEKMREWIERVKEEDPDGR